MGVESIPPPRPPPTLPTLAEAEKLCLCLPYVLEILGYDFSCFL